MVKVVLETNINHEPYAEDGSPIHPFAYLPFDEVKSLIEQIEMKYPEYDNFEYELKMKSHGYGAVSEWYDLVGYNNE